MSENTTEVQLLLRVISLLQALLQQQAPKRLPFPPLPRVKTARDDVRARRRERHRGRLLRLLEEAQARFAALQQRAEPVGDGPGEHTDEDAANQQSPAGRPVVDLGHELVEDLA